MAFTEHQLTTAYRLLAPEQEQLLQTNLARSLMRGLHNALEHLVQEETPHGSPSAAFANHAQEHIDNYLRLWVAHHLAEIPGDFLSRIGVTVELQAGRAELTPNYELALLQNGRAPVRLYAPSNEQIEQLWKIKHGDTLPG